MINVCVCRNSVKLFIFCLRSFIRIVSFLLINRIRCVIVYLIAFIRRFDSFLCVLVDIIWVIILFFYFRDIIWVSWFVRIVSERIYYRVIIVFFYF